MFLLSLWGVSLIVEILGLTQHFFSWSWLLILLPFYFLFLWIFDTVSYLKGLNFGERILVALIFVIWLIHFTGVLVPETGFDAVWYHLPIADAFIKHGGFFYLPQYYQSLNPYFSDGIFMLGYSGLSELGAKFVAYLFGLATIFVSYLIARKFLNRFWALLFVLTISTFQVVTWQSSSFYVDVAKAFWELAAIYFLMNSVSSKKKNTVLASLFFGASLATKLFSLFLLPAFLMILFKITQGSAFLKNCLIFNLVSILVALPFYLFAYAHTGNLFYSLGVHQNKLAEIGGNSSVIGYLWQRTLLLPSSLTQLTLFSRDYTTLLLFIFPVLIFIYLKKIWKQKELVILLIFSVNQWLLWWYLPPLSTRYALSGFITLALILFWCLQRFTQENLKARNYVVLTVLMAVILNLLPRMVVLQRNLDYILGTKNKEQYLQQFYDGSIDNNLKIWHQIK